MPAGDDVYHLGISLGEPLGLSLSTIQEVMKGKR